MNKLDASDGNAGPFDLLKIRPDLSGFGPDSVPSGVFTSLPSADADADAR